VKREAWCVSFCTSLPIYQSANMSLPFTPAPDVVVILNALLDIYERHEPGRPFVRAIRVRLGELELPGYTSHFQLSSQQGYV